MRVAGPRGIIGFGAVGPERALPPVRTPGLVPAPSLGASAAGKERWQAGLPANWAPPPRGGGAPLRKLPGSVGPIAGGWTKRCPPEARTAPGLIRCAETPQP